MLEWLLMLTMAGLGAIAFAILFKSGPAENTDLENEKLRQNINQLVKKEEQSKKKEEQKKRDEHKKKAEREKAEKEKKQKKDPKKDDKKPEKANRSPERERAKKEPEEKEKEEIDDSRTVYVPMVPIQNDTPTTKGKRDTRSRSPISLAIKQGVEKEVKQEVKMPNKKDIQRDLSQGFVVVQKKGPPPLTPEQRAEREALRQKEEEEEKRREAESLQREKERERKRAEAAQSVEVSIEDVKNKINKYKQERQSKEEERRRVNCVVKQYAKSTPETEEAEIERRSWAASMVPEGDMPEFDAEDYPHLQPTN